MFFTKMFTLPKHSHYFHGNVVVGDYTFVDERLYKPANGFITRVQCRSIQLNSGR